MISTFGSFSTAKLGIRSSQQGLQITGNNISNINTNGYTRQRINQQSLYHGAADRYSSSTDIRMGFGSLVTSVSQIRDPFLDIRYRNEAANVGFHDATLAHLEELKNILDEVSKDGIHTGLEEIRTQLQNLIQNPNAQENDGLVRAASQKLVSLLNKYAADLNNQKQDSLQGFDQNVDEVNKILSQIQELNIEIRKSELHGDPALEMLDNRNLLIDRLSEMAKIKVTYSEEKISSGISVNKLTIELDAPGQDPKNRPVLIDGDFANKLEIKPLGTDGKPDPSAEDYDISLSGLQNTAGDNPIVAQMKQEMQTLNNQVNTLNSLNQKFEELATKRQTWTTEATKANAAWNEAAFNQDREKTLNGLKEAVKKAQEAARKDPANPTAQQALEKAQENLRTFNKLDKENAEMNKQKEQLVKQQTNTVNALDAGLKKHGLNINPPLPTLPTADGKITISVNVGTPAPGNSITLVGGANTTPAKFDTVVDPATGELTLQLDGKEFKKIESLGEIEKQLNSLNDQLQTLHDINKKLDALQKQEKDWGKKIKKPYKWTEKHFDKNYDNTLKNLQKNLEDARKKYAEAKPDDKETTLAELKKAQDTLKTFNEFKREYDDIKTQQTMLGSQVQSKFNALNEALKKQGLEATLEPTPYPPANNVPFTIKIKGQAGNLATTETTVIDKNTPTNPPQKFGSSIDPTTGELSLKLGNTNFKTVPAGQFDKTAQQVDSLKDGKLYGVLEADLQFLNGKGEFDTPPNKVRGIAYYQRSLDTLAQNFAETLNKLNQHPAHPDENRALFESGDPNNKNITASNISISKDWESGKVKITTSTDPAAGTGDTSNIHNMISALEKDQPFKAVDANGNVLKDDNGKDREIFKGSFEGMFTHINATLGSDMSTTAVKLNNYAIAANERAVARDNVSSVDLNEEGINLVQYQKSFAAACRVMTTLDQMLETLLQM